MNHPPLNPDALEAAARATYEMRNPESWARTWDELDPEEREEEWVKPTRTSTLAYLAAALPEVTSVEELDQLPDRSVVLDADGAACQRNGFGMDGNCWDSMGEEMLSRHIPLPARVLYRPEVKP